MCPVCLHLFLQLGEASLGLLAGNRPHRLEYALARPFQSWGAWAGPAFPTARGWMKPQAQTLRQSRAKGWGAGWHVPNLPAHHSELFSK